MKLSWGFTVSSLCCSIAAASKAGYVYVWDSSSKAPSSQPASVSPATARLVLAQRLGVSRFHSIQEATSSVIHAVDEFGGRPVRLFGGDEGRNDAHALVWIEGVEDVKALESSWTEHSAFAISNPPPKSVSNRLIDDFILQAESLPAKADPQQKMYNTHLKNEQLLRQIQEPSVHNDYLSILRTGKGGDKEFVSRLATTISKLSELAKQDGSSLTVVLMPPVSGTVKRSANPYGTYELPAAVVARLESSEALLSSSPEPSAVAENLSVTNLESFPHISENKLETEPVLGILPSCFRSARDCQKKTHSCTGRGECVLAHNGTDAQTSCWSCRCKAAVLDVKGGGKKTTHWGGPACQKKDVSIPFWLFVGTTVVLVFLVGGGIGMLYTMGSEELPSVIGAGVSGPVKK